MSKVKIITIGDGGVGKTSILVTYSTENFPTKHVPTVFDNFEDDVVVEGEKIVMELWDTAGQEEYDRLRPICYKDCGCFIICYSINNLDSLKNIRRKWIPEIEKFCPGVPFIIVGTKRDLRGTEHDLVPFDDAKKMVAEVNANDFITCSAKTQTGLKRVMISAAKHAKAHQLATKKCCTVL